MYYQRSSAFIGGLQRDRHRSPTTVWPQMNADKRRFARDLLRLSSYFLDITLVAVARLPAPSASVDTAMRFASAPTSARHDFYSRPPSSMPRESAPARSRRESC